MTLATLIERLGGKPKGEDKGAFRCPAHDDNTASGTLGIGKDGKLLVHCQAGCKVRDILSAANLAMSDLYPEKTPRHSSEPISTYDYVDEAGDLLYQVLRYVPKTFRQRRPYQGAWAWGLTAGLYEQGRGGDWYKGKAGRDLPAVRRVLYRLPELLASSGTVFVVEGEKDVESLRTRGAVATTNVGGAGRGKWLAAYAAFLKGRHVVILPDNDEAGALHAATVLAALRGVAASVRIVRLPGLAPKGDVSDWLKTNTLESMPEAPIQEEAPEPETAAITDETPKRPLSSRSYHSAVTIIGDNRKDVLHGKRLEWDDMAGEPTLDRVPMQDADLFRLRYTIEERFDVGDGKGMKFSVEDIKQAIVQVASTRSYHPVRDYLSSLRWDGRDRLLYVPDLIGAERTALNQALLRRWFIAAVARPFRPGCKVDNMLVLVGKQGIGKSSFFALLAHKWFCDSAIDIHSKDAFMVLARAWLMEWAELESLNRARDASAVKAFLTSATDTFRRPWGHVTTSVPRSGIIVGSTNNRHFLADETGSRRFWPIDVTEVDREAVIAQRDQLWAEAVELYHRGEQWHLTAEETGALLPIHEEHRSTDAWEPTIIGWAQDREPFTTADVLEMALGKAIRDWTRGDEMRVAKVLRANGWEAGKPHRGARPWIRPS